MRAVLHKCYLATQALILILGAAWCIWIGYAAYGYGFEVQENARNCAMRAISMDLPPGFMDANIHKWVVLVRTAVSVKGSQKAMIAEADRITKSCGDALAVEVSEKSGEVSVFVGNKGSYKPARDMKDLFFGLGFAAGCAALLSVLLFVLRKWIGIVFK